MPAEPASKRVSVGATYTAWALYLQQCVCILPTMEGLNAELSRITSKIPALRGDFTLIDLLLVPPKDEARFVSSFRTQRASENAELVVVCETYRGASARGGAGWAIIDQAANPRRLTGAYERDEGEQVRYLRELLEVFDAEGLDSAFWFTFAGYELPHRADPVHDLDLASYGVVKMRDPGLDQDRATADLGWEPKEAFAALAGVQPPGAC
jgi:hypothetical protein